LVERCAIAIAIRVEENPISADKERMLNCLKECLAKELYSLVEWFYSNINHQREMEEVVRTTFSTIQADESGYVSSEEEFY